jgi:hypothetical protein
LKHFFDWSQFQDCGRFAGDKIRAAAFNGGRRARKDHRARRIGHPAKNINQALAEGSYESLTYTI